MLSKLRSLDGTYTLLLGSMLCAFDLIAAAFSMLPATPLYTALGIMSMLTMLIGGLQLLLTQQRQDLLELLTDMTL